ncbi:MAG: homoserine O-acetyltransferase [Gammaproteobacteria bacterium]|nr:homoserine O-acetyltransferase [Gammaproteobacteria bacterium]MBU6508942.1 homoserine O-acetyltransferase [Gammaproteobacteria bacterium]MDE1983627.1 homoserine O-acetyltransferase [Gammaproteobacteria bacterium]MDE2108282.1 homoserine O-acetyltransferase [Gammaproteobacteria bacterium]MDE2459898.1 homoserine O-acetyltransferase [Gammaproteobacteria bacterium]
MQPKLTVHSDTAAPNAESARHVLSLPGTFTMHLGGELQNVQIAYETWGKLAPDRSNALLLFTGLSPSAHAASSPADPTPGWWEEMLGPGKPLDSQRFFVLCINSLGSCFGSTGPSSLNPETGKPYALSFPTLTVEDIATAAHAALATLGIRRVQVVMGASLGGMSALAYALLFPGAADVLVSLSSATHSEPFAIAVRSLQRELIRSDGAWQGGNYPSGDGPRAGMRLARKLGMMSYRSAAEWLERFGRERADSAEHEPFGLEFEVESYLESRARAFVGGFDANSYLYLSRAMDLFDAAEHGGTVAKAFKRLKLQKALVVGVETDILFPLHQQCALAEGFERAGIATQYLALPSKQGHDSFLVDMDRFRPAVGDFLAAL